LAKKKSENLNLAPICPWRGGGNDGQVAPPGGQDQGEIPQWFPAIPMFSKNRPQHRNLEDTQIHHINHRPSNLFRLIAMSCKGKQENWNARVPQAMPKQSSRNAD
jgi:hypothetical protein